MTGQCKMCRERGKDWSGSEPVCAFVGEFSANWNCATLNAIRDICYEGQELPPGVDYRYCDDQKYAAIDVNSVYFPDESVHPLCLWVSWYKNRGGTDAMWLLFCDRQPRIPTERELLAVIREYSQRGEA